MEEEKLCDNLGQGEEGKIEGKGEKFINKTILLLATSLSPPHRQRCTPSFLLLKHLHTLVIIVWPLNPETKKLAKVSHETVH